LTALGLGRNVGVGSTGTGIISDNSLLIRFPTTTDSRFNNS